MKKSNLKRHLLFSPDLSSHLGCDGPDRPLKEKHCLFFFSAVRKEALANVVAAPYSWNQCKNTTVAHTRPTWTLYTWSISAVNSTSRLFTLTNLPTNRFVLVLTPRGNTDIARETRSLTPPIASMNTKMQNGLSSIYNFIYKRGRGRDWAREGSCFGYRLMTVLLSAKYLEIFTYSINTYLWTNISICNQHASTHEIDPPITRSSYYFQAQHHRASRPVCMTSWQQKRMTTYSQQVLFFHKELRPQEFLWQTSLYTLKVSSAKPRGY